MKTLNNFLAAFAFSVLPIPELTPGVVNTNVTAEMLRSPQFIKASRNVPESEKKEVFRRYGIPWEQRSKHEIDHLIPLCLAGDNSISNLWCEPWSGRWGARTKDRLEVYLHKQVNSGKLSLSDAQTMIATNWTNAFIKCGLSNSKLKTALFKLTHKAVK